MRNTSLVSHSHTLTRTPTLTTSQLWSRVSNLRFHQVRGPADIEIKFGDIDGKYTILGLTRYPDYGGDATFDKTENWKFGVAKRGMKIY